MTDREIVGLLPGFSGYLRQFAGCFLQARTRAHFDAYCRGLLSDLPRKSVEPMALSCGTTVRTLQVFLADSVWDDAGMRRRLQERMAAEVRSRPSDGVGVVGVIDETSAVKKGTKTPGVQRQYLGCVGKVGNGIVTVHVGVCVGEFRTLLTGSLYLPESWAEDRDRCRAAGIPDAVGYRAKWRIAFDQLVELYDAGHRFDWLTFDEGYGGKRPFLDLLTTVGQKFVAEIPVNFRVTTRVGLRRADRVLTAANARRGRRFRIGRKTVADQTWRAVKRRVTVNGRPMTLVVAICEATGEVKWFLANASAPVRRLLRVAFRRWTVEHLFRVAKQELGFTHFEGRHYSGLMRHLTLCLVVMGFVALTTDRLRGEKSGSDDGTSLPSPQPAGGRMAVPPPTDAGPKARRPSDPLPSAA